MNKESSTVVIYSQYHIVSGKLILAVVQFQVGLVVQAPENDYITLEHSPYVTACIVRHKKGMSLLRSWKKPKRQNGHRYGPASSKNTARITFSCLQVRDNVFYHIHAKF